MNHFGTLDKEESMILYVDSMKQVAADCANDSQLLLATILSTTESNAYPNEQWCGYYELLWKLN